MRQKLSKDLVPGCESCYLSVFSICSDAQPSVLTLKKSATGAWHFLVSLPTGVVIFCYKPFM